MRPLLNRKNLRAAHAVQVVDAAALPQVTEQSRHIARLLRREKLTVLGLCPVNDGVAVLPAAAQIGVALAEQSGAPVALVDVNVRWSALSSLEPSAPQAGPQPKPERTTAVYLDSLLTTRWLAGDRLALLSLPRDASIGAGLLEMARLLQSGRSMFENLLIDLTGLERLGEHLAAAAMCDALVFVARAGESHEDDLLRTSYAFAGHRALGVILVGTKS